jgi:hypothetical protein
MNSSQLLIMASISNLEPCDRMQAPGGSLPQQQQQGALQSEGVIRPVIVIVMVVCHSPLQMDGPS